MDILRRLPYRAVPSAVLAIATFFIPTLSWSQSVSDSTNIDSRWNRSWPAGPYSQVSTAFGVLQTEIPIFKLDGPGNSSMVFSISHRSNQSNTGILGLNEGGAGLGWWPSTKMSCNGGTNFVETRTLNQTNHWYTTGLTGTKPNDMIRRAGVRSDLEWVPNAYNSLDYYKVTDQATKAVYNYRYVPDAGSSLRYISSIVDTHGNTVSYTYL